MAKLNQLILLEKMMGTYDEMNIKDANLTKFQGACTEKLVDEIIGRLEKMVVSKTRLSCRNVLVTNFETMTKETSWLKCKLFNDLPRAVSKVLQEKVKKMVELLNMLMLKILNVDEQYAATFFRKLKEGYGKKRITEYELWKARLPELTMDLLEAYQVQLTANMLMMGVLMYDIAPTDEELERVQLEKVQQKLRHGKVLPEWFRAECAKLRRYSHWEGECFVIDYKKLRRYMFQHFGALTQEQRIALFEYDVQLNMIHGDFERLKGEEEEEVMECATDLQMKKTIEQLEEEGTLKNLYDYTWIMSVMNQTQGLPDFNTPSSLITYLKDLHIERLPSEDSINRKQNTFTGTFPDWIFIDCDTTEAKRRINVGKRFLNIFRAA